MEHRRASLPRIGDEFIVGLNIRTRHGFRDDIARQSWRLKPLPDQPQTANHGPPIPLIIHITRIDRRLILGPKRPRFNLAAAERAHLPHSAGHAGCIGQPAGRAGRVAGGGEQRLNIRGRGFRQHFHGRGDQRRAIRQQTPAADDITHDFAGQAQSAGFFVEGWGVFDGAGDSGDKMILEVFADPTQRVMHANANVPEMLGVADPG